MCGRFTLTAEPEALQDAFPEFHIPMQMSPRYNIAPTQPIAVIPNDGKNQLDFYIWGLVPSWAKDPQIGSRLINARGETLAEKPSFRSAYRRRRCLVVGDGFYEWKKIPGQKSKAPFFIQLKSGEPFGFAGLWEQWTAPDGSEIKSATIITTEPNELVKSLHDRMPVILPRSAYDRWLFPGELPPEALQDLLISYPSEKMSYHPVSTLVNSPSNDNEDCIKPI